MKIKGFGGMMGGLMGEVSPYALTMSSALGMLEGGDGTETGGGGGGGGGDGGTGSETPTPSPTPSASDDGAVWYGTGVTDDESKTWLQNKGYASLEDTIKAHRSLETKLGAGRFNVPSDWTDEAQAKAAYKALGLPDAVGDAYKVDLPEGADGTFANTFAEKAHAAGVLPHQWKAIAGAYLEAEQAAAGQAETAAKEAMTTDIAALKSGTGWGADFEKNDAIAGAAAKAFGIDVARLAKSYGTKDAMELLLNLGKKTGEDGIEGGGARPLGGMNGATAAEAKKTFMADADKSEKLRNGDPAAKAEWARINAALAAELDRAQAE